MLEMVIDDLYSYRELENNGLEPLRYYGKQAIFTDGAQGYIFNIEPFKQLRIRLRYQKTVDLPKQESWTDFDTEQYEEALKNCCHPLRMGFFQNGYK